MLILFLNGMKNIIFSLIIVSFLIVGCQVKAQENLPDPGLTPDSTFYFLKTWKESIQTFFTFGAENKAKQYLHLADVRLAEYQKMVEKGKTEIAEKILAKYEKQLNHALSKVEELNTQGKDTKDISEKIKTNKEKSCKNSCGDKTCDETVCMAIGCPCAETKETCPQDCDKKEENKTDEVKNTNEQPKIVEPTAKAEETLTNMDKFTKCLTDKGVKLYGASWCSHCANQKKIFGDSLKYLTYVECALSTSNNGQTTACQTAKITAYPTWEFPNGQKKQGELPLSTISQLSGCELEN